jgi:guanylate cyclase
VVFLASLFIAAAMDGRVTPRYVVPDPAMDAAINLAVAMAVTFGVLAYFARQRDRYQRESDDLLHNILPASVAERLKAGEVSIADDITDVSVLFADIVAFTPMSATLEAPEVVGILNDVFMAFDALVDDLGLEKIKTVGDEYMVAAGLPEPRPDHADALATLALAMRDLVASSEFRGHRIELRIGISSGPVVAGVIGTHKFSYDLWGSTVNTASRMESTGMPGRIQISGATCALIADGFHCEPRGVIAVKGLPDMETWFLEGAH